VVNVRLWTGRLGVPSPAAAWITVALLGQECSPQLPRQEANFSKSGGLPPPKSNQQIFSDGSTRSLLLKSCSASILFWYLFHCADIKSEPYRRSDTIQRSFRKKSKPEPLLAQMSTMLWRRQRDVTRAWWFAYDGRAVPKASNGVTVGGCDAREEQQNSCGLKTKRWQSSVICLLLRHFRRW